VLTIPKALHHLPDIKIFIDIAVPVPFHLAIAQFQRYFPISSPKTSRTLTAFGITSMKLGSK
jgi:hypothetical protein